MNCYAVIDTNVLVSSLLSKKNDSATVLLIERLFKGDIIPVYSNEIMQEYREVLNRKKFKFDTNLINYILSAIEKYGILMTPSHSDAILPDMKDLPFYQVVMDTREDNTYLVTGNLKHFPCKPFIVTARQMLDILDNISI